MTVLAHKAEIATPQVPLILHPLIVSIIGSTASSTERV